MALREAIIRNTAAMLQPDIFIVDKEPTGFRGEIIPTLEAAKARGARLVLGIRDVMDEPALLVPEWERKGAVEALIRYYDDIWIYGLKEIYQPLVALDLPAEVDASASSTPAICAASCRTSRNLDALPQAHARALRARHDRRRRRRRRPARLGDLGLRDGPHDPAAGARRVRPVHRRATRGAASWSGSPSSTMSTPSCFDAKIEHLMKKATAIVAMGGYNTFCEILSFDKPALIVPRKTPRLEQAIRASCAERLGLVHQLDGLDAPDRGGTTRRRWRARSRPCAHQPKPSEAIVPGLLDGLDRIEAITKPWLEAARRGRPLAPRGRRRGMRLSRWTARRPRPDRGRR